jgi:hypothetical protein
MVGHGRMSELADGEVAGLLQAMLQQQTAMLQVQAESVRLQRLLVERLLDAPSVEARIEAPAPAETASWMRATPPPAVTPAPAPDPPTSGPATGDVFRASDRDAHPPSDAAQPEGTVEGTRSLPPSSEQTATRGARYYQPRPAPAAPIVKPEDLELLRRLQEMREASGLILQFGPFKGTTLAQVALSHPEYVRQLVTRAQRPEVRTAAGRLVEALDAAAEHQRSTARGTGRRGRSSW